MEDNIVYFDKDTPKIEQANKVRSLLAVNGDDDTIGSVDFDLLVLEAGKNVGDAVKIDGLVLPTLGAVNKKATVRGGSEGKTFTYTDPETSQVTTIEVGVNMVADLFWDAVSKSWSKADEELLPMREIMAEIQNGSEWEKPVSEAGTKKYVDDKTISKIGTVNNIKPTLTGSELTLPDGFVINNKSRQDFTQQTLTLPSGVFRLLFDPKEKEFSSQPTNLPVDTKVFWDIGAFYLFAESIIPVDTTSFFFDWLKVSVRNKDLRAEYNGTPTSFNYDFVNKQIILQTSPANIVEYKGIVNVVQNQTLPMSNSAVQFLYYRPSSNTFNLFDSTASSAIPKDDIWISTIRPSGQLVTMIGDNYAINGVPKNILISQDMLIKNRDVWGKYIGIGTSFNYDFVNKQIVLQTSSANIIEHRGKARYIIPSQTIPMTSAAIQFLHYSPWENKFYITDSSATFSIPNDDIMMAEIRPSSNSVVMIGNCYTVNGKHRGGDIISQGRYVGSAEALDFAFEEKKIKIKPLATNRFCHVNVEYPVVAQEIPMIDGVANQILYYDTVLKTCGVIANINPVALGSHCFILGDYRINAKYVTMLGANYSIDGIPQSKGNGLSKRIVFDMGLDDYYIGNTDRSMTESDTLYIRDTDPAYVNGLFDELMASAPAGYITKQEIGQAPTTDHGNIPVYAYSFNPPKNGYEIYKEDFMPKVFINCGTHGGEKMTPFVVHDFLKDMLDNWQSKPFLEFCRFNIPFVIVPLLNADGWYKNRRVNMNGVDINRNYSNGWALSGAGTEQYSGPSAFSEVESRIIRDFVKDISPKFIGIDFHNFSANTTMWYFESHNQFLNNVGRAISQVVSRKIKSKYSWIPQGINEIFGYSRFDTQKEGKTAAYLESIGMYGLTLETGQGLQYNPAYVVYDVYSFSVALDLFGNALRLLFKHCSLNYNSKI